MRKYLNAFMLFLIYVILFCSIFLGCNKSKQTIQDCNIYTTEYDYSEFGDEISEVFSSDQMSAEGSAETSTKKSNKLLSWGIARKGDHKTPNADPGAPELLQKYNSLYIADINEKVIYLTFDEGYENGYTDQILDTLFENNVKAVFFITGPYLKEQQKLVRRMVEEGHIVGNHSVHHKSLPTLTDEEIEDELLGLDRAFTEKFSENMVFLRPPKGEYSERTLSVTQNLGYINLFWSFAYDDWHTDKSKGADYAYKMVMDNLHNGAVILLHAVSKDNADALDRIIKEAKNLGYTFGNIYDAAISDLK